MNRLPVLERTYDFVRWAVPVVTQFPRDQRYLLGERIETASLELLDLLVEAQHAPQRRAAALERADVRVARITYLLRLSHDLGLLSEPRYESGSRVLADIGRQIGGWLRRGRPAGAPPHAGRPVAAPPPAVRP